MSLFDKSSFRHYLNSIGRTPLLTSDEEIQLGRIIRQASNLQGKADLTPQEKRLLKRAAKAKRRFVEANLRLVVYVAKRFSSKVSHMELLDLVQEGALGLMRAVELFDPERGYKFSTYSYWWVRQAMHRAINAQERTIRRPNGVAETFNRLPKAFQQLQEELGRMPLNHELAAALKVKESELDLMRERGRPTVSLDLIIGEDDQSRLVDFVADPESTDLEDQELLLDIDIREPVFTMCLEKLSDNERKFLKMRYGLLDGRCYTLKEIGDDSGISRERARQVIGNGLRRLRFNLTRHGWGPGGIHKSRAELLAEQESGLYQTAA